MGSVTNLEKNKTLFISCDCKSKILIIDYDHGVKMADFAIYENSVSYCHKMSLWQRIRYCYQVLVNKKPYADQITLTQKQILELKSFLNSLNF